MGVILSKQRVGLISGLGVLVVIGLLVTATSAAGSNPAVAVTGQLSPIQLHAAIELTSSASHNGGVFGISVAVSGKYVVVGAPGETHSGDPVAGNVYLYNSTTGQLLATIGSPHPKDDGYFGWSVAVSGSTLVVGAPNETAQGKYLDAGNTYIYSVSGSVVTLEHTLVEAKPQAGKTGHPGGLFGYSVSISGSDILVGAANETSGSVEGAGSAYIYSTAGMWVANLTTPNPAFDGYFGFTVALDGATAYVGAPGEGSGGHTYIVFKATGPADARTTYVLGSPHPQGGGEFGWSVAFSGDYLLVGAPSENVSSDVQAGNAYVFNATSGLFTRSLANPDPQQSGFYGYSVAASGTDLIVAASQNNENGAVSAGNVTLFNATNGGVLTQLVSPNYQDNGDFGESVAADESYIVVGAPNEQAGTVAEAGHAYIY
jgi:hypothetical protein